MQDKFPDWEIIFLLASIDIDMTRSVNSGGDCSDEVFAGLGAKDFSWTCLWAVLIGKIWL